MFKALPLRSGTCQFNSLYWSIPNSTFRQGKKKKDVRLERIKASFADMIFADDCIHIQSKIT